MGDRIYGRVKRVIDGDTLDVLVTRRSSGNTYGYNEIERVRLAKRHAPEPGTAGAAAATRALEQRVRGRGLRIDVQARDRYHRVIAKATLTPKRGR